MKAKLLKILRDEYFITPLYNHPAEFILVKKDYSKKTFIKHESGHSKWIDFFKYDFFFTSSFDLIREKRSNKQLIIKANKLKNDKNNPHLAQ